MRGIEALYVVRTANGVDYSTKFDKESLAEFVPKRTVSEMLKSWEETIKRRYDEAKLAVRSGYHPFRTFERETVLFTPSGHEYKNGEIEIVRSKIDRYEKNHYRHVAEQLEQQFGAMQFVKIC